MLRALLLAVLLVGCGTPELGEVTPTAVSIADIQPRLESAFNVFGEVADHDYLLPSLDWVSGDFSNQWCRFKSTLGEWTSEENDCDDFSRGAAFFAQLVNHDTKHKPHAALAFGEFWYIRSDGKSHAINFFVYRDGQSQQLKIGFFEPQDCAVISLSTKEINSCLSWRL